MEMSVSATLRKVEQRLNYPRSGRQPNPDDDTWPGASQRFNVTIEDGGHRSKAASKSLDRKVKGKRLGKTNAKLTGRQRQEKKREMEKRVAEEKEKMTPPIPSSTFTPKPRIKSSVVSAQGASSASNTGNIDNNNSAQVRNFINMGKKNDANSINNGSANRSNNINDGSANRSNIINNGSANRSNSFNNNRSGANNSNNIAVQIATPTVSVPSKESVVVGKKLNRKFGGNRNKSPSDYKPAYSNTTMKATKAVAAKKKVDGGKFTADRNMRILKEIERRNKIISEERAQAASKREEEEQARAALIQRAAVVERMDMGDTPSTSSSTLPNGSVFGGPINPPDAEEEKDLDYEEEEVLPSSASRRFVSKEDSAEDEEEEDAEDEWHAPLAAPFLDKDVILSLCHSLLEEKEEEEEKKERKREKKDKKRESKSRSRSRSKSSHRSRKSADRASSYEDDEDEIV